MSDNFERIQWIIREKGITGLDVWNTDETNFQIGL